MAVESIILRREMFELISMSMWLSRHLVSYLVKYLIPTISNDHEQYGPLNVG